MERIAENRLLPAGNTRAPSQAPISASRPASRGTCRATAVKPRPTLSLPTPLRATGAQYGVKDHCPLREPRGPLPSGGNSAANRLFSSSSAPYGRGVGSRGTAPCASREARRRAAVTSQPIGFSQAALRATGAQSGVQGYYPCCLEVEVGDQLGVLLDEFLAGVYLLAHEQ